MSEITFQSAVEQIKNSLDIVDVISKHVVLRKAGHIYSGLCPFHNEKTPSFTVTPSKQIFKCFGCGEGGDVFTFLMKISNQSFGDMIEEQAQALGIELPQGQSKEKTEFHKLEKEELLKMLDKTMKFYHENLLDNEKALEYLKKRGVGEVAISKFFLGLAPNSSVDLKNYLRNKNYTNDQMLKAGVVYEKNGEYYDRFRNRLIIPIMNTNSDCIAFGGRAMLDGQNPKYINSPDSNIYNKSSILFGMNYAKDAIKEEDSVIIMEGYFDVISAQVNGVKNAVASCGTALTPQHIKLISRYTQSRKIFLAFDSDDAGKKATQSGAEVIKNIFENLGNIEQYDIGRSSIGNSVCEIRVISQLGGKDPDEYIQEFGAEEYKKQIKNAPLLLDYQLEQVFNSAPKNASAQEKSKLVNDIAQLLTGIKDPVILSEYYTNLASKMNVNEKALRDQVNLLQRNLVTNYEVSNTVIKMKQKPAKSGWGERFSNMETNLVKLAFVADTSEKRVYYRQSIEGYKPKDEQVSKVLAAIDKLVCAVNNVDELAKKLFLEFYQDSETHKYITDQLYSSNEFENLNYENYIQAVEEIFQRLNNLEERRAKDAIRRKYRNSDISDVNEETELKISQEIFEKFGQR